MAVPNQSPVYTFNPTPADKNPTTIHPRPLDIPLERVPIYIEQERTRDEQELQTKLAKIAQLPEEERKKAQQVEQELFNKKYDYLGQRNKTQADAIDALVKQEKHTIHEICDDQTSKSLNEMLNVDLDPGKPIGQQVKAFLGWTYGCYHVKKRTSPTIVYDPNKEIFQSHIYLFNIIIAFEWEPSKYSLDMLERALRRASDFLFDVTDGWMAIGQVVIGGPDLMDCADVQVMASNRLHPRSWVGGLHEPDKYLPIRIGRGMWQKNNRLSIPRDEPEGYRTLVHEWAHYALELRDAYVESHLVYIPEDVKIQEKDEARRSNRNMVVPAISQPVESIMSTLEGTSELVANPHERTNLRKSQEWDTIINGFDGLQGRTKRFPRILTLDCFNPLEGPLPLRELPHIVRLVPNDATQIEGIELLLTDQVIQANIDLNHCWAYILQYEEDGKTLSRIMEQGTLDAQLQTGFRLLGAKVGDYIVLIGNDLDGQIKVLRAKIEDGSERLEAEKNHRRKILRLDWDDCTPSEGFPVIDVIPHPLATMGDQAARIKVQVSRLIKQEHGNSYGSYGNPTIFIAPFGNKVYRQGSGSEPQQVLLDGHVLVSWDQGTKLMITTYSQGGGPPTSSPTGNSPITAGSAEGNLMIFFADQGEYPRYNQNHSLIKVVTTRLLGSPGEASDGSQVRSYAFSLASNAALPLAYTPTLALAYDKRTELEEGTPAIYHENKNGTWERIVSYRPRGAWYVAAPLDRKTAPSLFDVSQSDDRVRVERYRLYLAPLARNNGKPHDQEQPVLKDKPNPINNPS